MSADFITAFATMFVMIDPIGLTPMFAALTAGMGFRERLLISLRGIAIAALILTVFGLAGDTLLDAVGVSLPAFRIAGGLMLFLLAVEMLFEKRTERREKQSEPEPGPRSDPSVFPLATPLIAGPGAMAAMILLVSEHPGDTGAQALIFLGMGAVLALCFVAFLTTEVIERVLGPTGIKVLTRLFGTLLGALAVQFVLDGLLEFWALSRA